MQLQDLKAALNKGDMNNSKKLFAQQSIETLGKDSHQKIQSAIRQYDFLLAEKFLNEVLEEISNMLNKRKPQK